MKLLTRSCLAILTSFCILPSVQADQVINDDLIVTFSECVGNDCVNGESFGFDTLRLKENNLRLHFDDTSNSASFPNNDWRIIANDSGNGGSNYLAIEDSTAGRIPFRVEAGAPANALVVESDGQIGIKTLNPVVDIHIVEGNTPTVRLEQDGSDGFTPQTWDMAGNEANFFIRDVTNGSQLPLQIKPGAPTASLFIAANGNIGLSDSTPDAFLDVNGNVIINVNGAADAIASTTEDVHIYDNGPARLALENTAAVDGGNTNKKWIINSNGTLRLSAGTDEAEFELDANGNLVLLGSITTAGGTCGSGCDTVFQSKSNLPSIEEHAKQMWDNQYLPNVGPTKENTPINLSDKLGRILNELETAHIYIEELHKRIEALESQ